jgi:hypothetical protein
VGSRCGPFWSTDAGVPDAFGLARRLASVFPSTGLWPVVWTWPGEAPDAYFDGPVDLARADSIDAESLLRRSWAKFGFARERPFPGIAAPEAVASRMGVQPFGETTEASRMERPPPGGWIVMLVPVNRPADVHSVLGLWVTEYYSVPEFTSVLRSWEERFGAVVSAFSPGTVELAVGAPPHDDEQALRLAAEHAAFAPEDEIATDLEGLPGRLRSTRIVPGDTSARYWVLGWPD